jgi:hypothetical protein
VQTKSVKVTPIKFSVIPWLFFPSIFEAADLYGPEIHLSLFFFKFQNMCSINTPEERTEKHLGYCENGLSVKWLIGVFTLCGHGDGQPYEYKFNQKYRKNIII